MEVCVCRVCVCFSGLFFFFPSIIFLVWMSHNILFLSTDSMGVFVKIQICAYILYIRKTVLFSKQIIKLKELRKDFRIWQKARAGKALVAFCPALILWRKQEVTQFLPNLGQGGEIGPKPKKDSQAGDKE